MGFDTKVTSVLVTLAVSIWIVPHQLAASSIRQVSTLSRKCDSGKQSACRELAEIAVKDKDASVRSTAVEKVTDQGLLAKVSLENKDASVRSVAVAKVTEQALLAKIALEDNDADVRLAAVVNLTDQALLARVAQEAKDGGVARAATAKLTDRSLLAQVVGKNIRDIRARVSNVAFKFSPTVTVTLNEYGIPTNMQASDPKTVAPNEDESFLVVEITFEPSHPFEFAATDVRLVVPDNLTGKPEAFGLLGDGGFVQREIRQDVYGNVIYARDSGPYWEDPKGETHQKMLISDKRVLSWMFSVGRNCDPRQFKVSVLGAEFSLGATQQ